MQTPQKLGRYEILSELGRGAMGVVYKAVDPVLDRIVAIKTIHLAFDQDERKEYEARFYQEAKAAGGLSHPNIVTIYDLGDEGQVAYMAMELLDGQELREMLDGEHPIPIRQCISITAQVASALGYAHERGVIHRDIKPANIMILTDGFAKIMDFGVARIRTSDVKTQTGLQFGSPKYMSPEQVLGKRADYRSDIFSLGIILYEMLTAKAPFAGTSLESLMYQTVNFVTPPPSRINPDVPEMLDLICAKLLEKDPANRYQSAREVASDLQECEKHYGGSNIATLAHSAIPQGIYESPELAPTPLDAHGDGRSRQSDEEPGHEIGMTTLGISPSFDSSQATLILAEKSGMLEEVEDMSATMRHWHGQNPPIDAAQGDNETTTLGAGHDGSQPGFLRSAWTRREKLFVGAMLLGSLCLAGLIALA